MGVLNTAHLSWSILMLTNLGSPSYFMAIYYWSVVGPPLWKIWKSIGMMRFPIYGKIQKMATKPPTRIRFSHWLIWRYPEMRVPPNHQPVMAIYYSTKLPFSKRSPLRFSDRENPQVCQGTNTQGPRWRMCFTWTDGGLGALPRNCSVSTYS